MRKLSLTLGNNTKQMMKSRVLTCVHIDHHNKRISVLETRKRKAEKQRKGDVIEPPSPVCRRRAAQCKKGMRDSVLVCGAKLLQPLAGDTPGGGDGRQSLQVMPCCTEVGPEHENLAQVNKHAAMTFHESLPIMMNGSSKS